jgi:isopentenyl phosphate kinase
MTICFLKLGGSLITNKDKADFPNLTRLTAISVEIARALKDSPDLKLVIGHGSGSFGHRAASTYHTRDGVKTNEDWIGFANVWQKARALNEIVLSSLVNAHIPAVVFPPSATIITEDHQIYSWSIGPLKAALENGLTPVIYGDVVFDNIIGGTILSTEELFLGLSSDIIPDRVLLAGTEPGVWKTFAVKDGIIPSLSPAQFADPTSMASSSLDVTGGMGSKVSLMLKLAQNHPSTEIFIFSGLESGNIYSSLVGKSLGTRITSQERG